VSMKLEGFVCLPSSASGRGLRDVDRGQDLTFMTLYCILYSYIVMRIESLGGEWRMVHGIKHIALFSSHAPCVQ
jgi:hypothetical protein